MRKKRNISQFLIFILAIAFMLAGCGSADNSKKAPSEETKGKTDKIIRVGYQKGNTINILKESGILEKKLEKDGYKVEWKEFSHGYGLLEGLFAGNIDFGHAADGPGIFAQASDKPLVYAGADLPNPEGVGVLVHKESGIKSIKELKGKKIGALKGGNHHYLAILALKDAGLSVDDVEWVFFKEAAEARAAFETKRIDALASYDPFLAAAEIDLNTINLTEGKDYGYPNRTFYYANVDFNKEHPELVDLILEAIDESDKWANENKPEVVKLLSKMIGIDEKIIDKAINRRKYGVDRINEEIIAAQQKQADIYYEIGLIPKKVDVSKDMPIK
ncbi:nitrate/sulfonate/bicarbonate ABC transporter substrate-binding protein [Bacillus methanolicus PB1]|uniref:Putative aliphatic sulfonates-binding protein n=1 Tax=Bacillus methanolicus PB1 TaxID=997296 RepID=I3DW60_BACMT|nr:aliphatic sulfonate ABC transporter substrate-binding protein [Bacillus methanolicus]EIJ78481.1 nitrate/sulfonate/bicarbonate ABC transporter substrate-binding protein [Bacillus methanolicus PB1]